MAIPFLGLRTHILQVADLDAVKNWYTKIFGFGPYFDEPFYVGFDVAGYEFGLQPGALDGPAEASNVVVYWGVADVEAAIQAMVENGATLHEAPTEVGGGIVVGAVRDPWGNVFGAIFNPHFKG
mgnify:CR=1 FL=1